MPKVQRTMQASHRAARGRGRRVSTSLAEINVVPLVDVMLVLLIIFMVAAPMMQRGIDVNLPVARRATQIAGERVVDHGARLATARIDRSSIIGEEQVRAEVLQERIRQKMETRSDKEVYLRGDGGVQYQELMDVIDVLKAAGVENVGMVAKMPASGERSRDDDDDDVSDVLRDRHADARRAAADGRRLGAACIVALAAVAACFAPRRHGSTQPQTPPTHGDDDHARRRGAGPDERRPDADGRPAGAGDDAARGTAEARAGAAAGGEDAGDDGAAAQREADDGRRRRRS